MLPGGGGVDDGAGDGRNNGSDEDAGVRELELQIDALYGMPSNSGGASGPSPVRVVQAPVVSLCEAVLVVHCDSLEWCAVREDVDLIVERNLAVKSIQEVGHCGGCLCGTTEI